MTETLSIERPVRFTLDDANNCGWCFNCGPGALCAVLHLTPSELRPMMGDFETKGYTNPTLMLDVLNRAGAEYRQVYRSDDPKGRVPKVWHGLMRELNPNNPVLAAVRGKWHAIAALIMHKQGVDRVEIRMEDADAFTARKLNIAIADDTGSIVVSLLNQEQTEAALKKHKGTVRDA